MQIENITVYNKETIDEVAKEFTKKYKSIIIIAIALLATLAILSSVLHRRINITTLMIYAIGIICLIIIGVVRVKTYKKNIFDRIKVINHNETVECKYTFDEEKTTINTAERSNTLYHADLKKIKSTANNYILIYEGNVFSVVSKNGFGNSTMHQNFCELFKC